MKTLYFILALLITGTLHAQKLRQTVLSGIASYYHQKFEGRRMANGENYSSQAFTAASNVLPLNKWVRVTNPSNGLSVIVKITDRMAKTNKRLVDLSMASAKKLNIIGAGIKQVKVEILTSYKPNEDESVEALN